MLYKNKKRAKAAVSEISKLNPRVQVSAVCEDIKAQSEEWISQFDVTVGCNLPSFSDTKFLDEITHKAGKAFYSAGVCGLFGYIFADLGPEYNYSLEQERANIASKVGPINSTSEIISITSKKDEGTKKFQDTLLIKEKYRKLADLVENVKTLGPRFASKKRAANVNPVFLLYLSLWRLQLAEKPVSEDSIKEEAVALCSILGLPQQLVDDNVSTIPAFLSTINIEIAPVASIIGGVLAQEVLNTISQKQNPLQNLFIFNGDATAGPVYKLE